MKRITSFVLAGVAAALVAPAPATSAPLSRSNVVFPSVVAVDLAANTVTLPLHRGTVKGSPVWYVITDVSDSAAAAKLGVLFAPLLASAGPAIGDAGGSAEAIQYAAGVDFSPARVLKVDATGAVTDAHAGSVGDADYSPLVRIKGAATVYNAPIVAAGAAPSDVIHHTDTLDRVVAINTATPSKATVTLALARGFTNGQPIAYISTDASEVGPAAIERSTYAPRLKKIAAGAIPIDVFFNGPDQGIPFAGKNGHLDTDATPQNVASIGSPLNIQATFPAPNNAPSGYTPLWDVYPALWTPAAIAGGKAGVLRSGDAVARMASAGSITSPDGKTFGRAGIFVNCPVVAFAEQRPS